MNASAPKSQSTKSLCNRIAVVFDFDHTLATDTFDWLLENLGLDAGHFRRERVQPLLAEGWDKVAARFYCLVRESKQRQEGEKITQAYLAQLGKCLQPFAGVTEMFDDLRSRVQELNPNIELQFYVITGGLAEIVRHTAIAPYLTRMWGCEFHYNSQGEIDFLKRSISHTEKTRYLMQIASGREDVDADGRSFAYRDIAESELYVPLSQMIYVGDGVSDIPCFSVLNDEGGITIGVYKGDTAVAWSDEVEVTKSQRVVNLAPADYQKDSELRRSLILAIESQCKQIALRQLSVGE